MLKKIFLNVELRWTIIAQVVQLFSGVLLIKMLTTNLSFESYGNFSLIMAVSAFVLTIPFTAIQQGFYRYRSVYNKKDLSDEFYSSMLIGLSFLIFIYFSLFKIISDLFLIDSMWNSEFISISILIISEIYKVFCRTIVNADRDKFRFATSIIVEFLIKLFLFFVFYFDFNNLKTIINVYSLSNVISILICIFPYVVSLKKNNLSVFKLIWKDVFVFSLPLLLWAVFGWLRDTSLRWFIEFNFGTKEVAIFTAISSLSIVIPMALQSILSAYIIPILYQNDGDDKVSSSKIMLNKLMFFLYIIGFVLFIILFLFSKEIISVFSDEKYVLYAWALPWMFISYFLFCCGMIIGTRFLVSFQPIKLLLPNVIPGIIVILMGVFIIPYFGMESIIITYSLSYISYFILILITLKRS